MLDYAGVPVFIMVTQKRINVAHLIVMKLFSQFFSLPIK